jgi:hypothetical protein
MIMITIIKFNYLSFIYFLTELLTVQLTSQLEQMNEIQDTSLKSKKKSAVTALTMVIYFALIPIISQ